MAWFKVDDRLWGHPKWLSTPVRARGLWVTAGSWAASQDQDGRIPRHVLPALGARPSDAEALVTAGLWATAPDGWVFHDWSVFQPDAASQKARREAESLAGMKGNHLRWHVKKHIAVPDCEFCQASGTRSGSRVAPESPESESPPNPPVPGPYPTLKAVSEGTS